MKNQSLTPAERANYNLSAGQNGKRYETSDKKIYARSSAGHLCNGKCKSLANKPLSVIYTDPKRYHLNEDNVCENDWQPTFREQGKKTYDECKAYLDQRFTTDDVTYISAVHDGQPYVGYKHPGETNPSWAYDCNTDGWIDVSEYYPESTDQLE